MARTTKRRAGKYMRVYYGIDLMKNTVETIWQQRDGTLVKSSPGGTGGGSHYPLRDEQQNMKSSWSGI